MSGDETLLQEGTPPPVEEGAPLWTVTFGDMMSLLLTFFILLFSMSELRMERFLLASQSLSEALGGTAVEPPAEPTGLVPDPAEPDAPMQASGGAPAGLDRSETAASDSAGGTGAQPAVEILADEYLDQIVRRLNAFIAEHGLEQTLLVARGPSGVRLQIRASALFEPGVGTVSEDGRWILEFLADLTREMAVPVAVAGHADNQPIANRAFASNWELSAVRAAGVARELVGRGHDPSLLRVESFGEHRPVASNDTEEGRARNRRVEFFYDRRDVVDTIVRWRNSLTMAEGVTRP